MPRGAAFMHTGCVEWYCGAARGRTALYGASQRRIRCERTFKLAFHDAETYTDILARIVARMSACRLACHRNNFRKSRVSDVSVRILARMSVSASCNFSFIHQQTVQ